MIDALKENEIFVFGSNLAGNHAGGAARQAAEQFGAEQGVGEGMTGQCYAFPTLDQRLWQRSMKDMDTSAHRFRQCALDNPDKTFLMTPVGTGIAGYPEKVMKSLFRDIPENVIKPKGW